MVSLDNIPTAKCTSVTSVRLVDQSRICRLRLFYIIIYCSATNTELCVLPRKPAATDGISEVDVLSRLNDKLLSCQSRVMSLLTAY